MSETDRCGVVYVRIDDGGYSPHTRLTARANCGGRGLCGTCGVRIDEGPTPDH